MVKQREETRAWAWVIFGLLFVGGIVVFFAQHSTVITVNNNATSTAGSVEEAPDVNAEKLEEIRSRAEIQRQQELLVKETFLKEEKDRISGEKALAISDFDKKLAELEAQKEKAIAEFDSQIANKETELEEIRADKLDFQ